MLSMESPDTHYRFPLSDDDTARLVHLKTCLQQQKKTDAINALHDVFKHIFYPRPFTGPIEDYSKFSNPIECLMAVYNLKDDGNFRQASEVTQMFAQIHYHIRGSILYEAMRHKADFDHDLVK